MTPELDVKREGGLVGYELMAAVFLLVRNKKDVERLLPENGQGKSRD